MSSNSNRIVDKKRDKLLVFTTGTFCDGTLSASLLHALQPYDIIYVTDEKIAPRDASLVPPRQIRTYSTPSFILVDPALGAADPQRNPVTWALTHPMQARQVYDWLKMIGRLMVEMEEKHKPDAVLVHFSLLASLMWADREVKAGGTKSLLGSVPHVVIYFNPGIPNATIPWLFDSRLRDPGFRLYDPKDAQAIRESWEIVLGRMSMQGGTFDSGADEARGMACALRDMHHVLCWDPEVIKPLAALVPGLRTELVGTLPSWPRPDKSPEQIPAIVRSFVKKWSTRRGDNEGNKNSKKKTDERQGKGGGVAFISFGSFGGVPKLRAIAMDLASRLVQDRNMTVIFHDTAPSSATTKARHTTEELDDAIPFLVYQGHIPYDAIVPRSSLVVFTGSMCLQTVCLRNRTPMVFVPTLTEQYFWAKNYERFTGMPYIDTENDNGVERIIRALSSPKVVNASRRYLSKTGDSLHNTDRARRALQNMMRRIIREKREQVARGALI